MLDRAARPGSGGRRRARPPKAPPGIRRAARSLPVPPEGAGRLVAIVVIGQGTGARALRDAAVGAELCLAGFDDLDADLLARHRPSLVLSWALGGSHGGGHDAIEIARRLVRAGFRGRYVALTRALPRPELVRAELARACPSLSIEVLALPAAPALLRAV